MEKTEIKYRNGLPTRDSLKRLIASFDQKMWRLRPTHSYGRINGNHTLMIYDEYTQSRIEEAMQCLTNNGISLGKYEPYNSSTMKIGFLEIKITKKNKTRNEIRK